MKSTGSWVLFVIAVVLGLFFGNALNGLLGAAILGAVTAAGAWFVLSRGEANPGGTVVQGEDPPLARFLFQDSRSSAVWLPIRLFIGWSWLQSGTGKFQTPA